VRSVKPMPRSGLRTREPEAMRDLQVLPPPAAADCVAVDYVRTDEAWDDAARIWRVSRSRVRLAIPLAGLRAMDWRAATQLASRPRRVSAPIAAGIALGASTALLLATIGGFLAARPQAPAAAPVEIDLGPPPPARQKIVAPAAAPPAPQPVVAPIVPEAAPPAQDLLAAALPAKSAPEPAQIDAFESVRQAFAKAVESGAAEPWQENGLSGYVVVGPSTIVDSNVCRNTAIWLDREGGTGQVVEGRKCLAPDGAWIDS